MAAYREVEQRRREGEVEQEAGVAVVGEVAGDHERPVAPQKVDLVLEGDAGAAGEARGAGEERGGLTGRQLDLGRQQPRAEALALLGPEPRGGKGDALVCHARRVSPGRSARRAAKRRAAASSRKST